MELKPGDKAPNFKLAKDSGENISLSSLTGHPFVLYFYPKDDTAGCTKEAQDFSEKNEAISTPRRRYYRRF
ncbi:MAG: redoxin domain-containing protein [Rhizomicrobium sp.]